MGWEGVGEDLGNLETEKLKRETRKLKRETGKVEMWKLKRGIGNCKLQTVKL